MVTDIWLGFSGCWNPCLPSPVAVVGVQEASKGEGYEASVGLGGDDRNLR